LIFNPPPQITLLPKSSLGNIQAMRGCGVKVFAENILRASCPNYSKNIFRKQ